MDWTSGEGVYWKVGEDNMIQLREYGYSDKRPVYIHPGEVAAVSRRSERDMGEWTVVTLNSGRFFEVVEDAGEVVREIMRRTTTYVRYQDHNS